MLDAPAILRQLIQHDVEFVVIGGLAMITHGSAHVTDDLDICYARTEKNVRAVATAFEALRPTLRGAPPGLPFRFDAPTILAGLNFTLTTDLGPVDLIGEVAGIGGFDEVLAASDTHVVAGLSVHVLSLEGLIAAKKAAGRLKDQAHLLELEELRKLMEEGL